MSTRLSFFVPISRLFQARFQNPHWDKYPGAEKDEVEAMCLFLGGYAFERQGSNPSYAHAAVTAIEEARIHPGPHLKQTVWDKFSGFLQGQKLNWKINPLGQRDGEGCNCVWCVFDGESLISAAKQSLLNEQAKAIWERLQRIRGVGPKIASLFLRDLAVRYGLAPKKDRHLLQPVDVWVRRTVQRLANNNGMGAEEIAEWIVDQCGEPELANQGIWYFGAQIAQSEFRLFNALIDQEYAKVLVEDHLRTLEATVAVAKDWID
jgi:hypothetical protein